MSVIKYLLVFLIILNVSINLYCQDRITELKSQIEFSNLVADTYREELQKHQKNYEISESLFFWVRERADYNIPDSFLRDVIYEASKYDNFILILSIIAEESRFNPFAHSNMNARGLTQIRPLIWLTSLKDAGIIKDARQLWNYKKNIQACNFILNYSFDTYSDLDNVLLRYVNGDSSYLNKVKTNLKELEQQI